ncbi:10060_t:CDS:1 [Dentiscutata erythropus]|uniref:10060_t:CDS:1 n=1 Tax=Dentiscutata erythropus TaxID=1348616 RepID=A0A9N9CN25_9GLOM|nr:10060_t:CDS:1 [Dentiscutata erythropus]
MRVFSKPRPVTSGENALYRLETVRDDDWDLLIWISSQLSWEIYAYLFIVIWNNTKFGEDRKRDFKEETTLMISYVRKLNKNMCIDDNRTKSFINLFSDYQNYRLNGYDIYKRNLITSVLDKLETRGLKHRYDFYEQLKMLPMKQKEKLRNIVLDRMKALIDIAQPDDKLLIFSGKDDDSNLKDELNALKNENDALREQIIELQKENSKYQAAHGNLTNLGFSDEDPNNIVKLDKDIKHLQDLLGDLTLICPEYEIDVTKCNELLSFYKCNVEIDSRHGKKVLSAALQRLTIETIIDETKNYFLINGSAIEVNLVAKTKEIVDMTNSFTKKYAENDEIAKAIPIKIRQQVHSMLGCYAFSYDDHLLLTEISTKVLEKLEQYRKIIDSDEDNEIIQIIRGIIQLFFYRLEVHPIIPTYKFYENGTEMNPLFMESAGTKSKDMKKLEVEICYFPAIAVFDTIEDKSDNVFSKALIIPRVKSNNSISSETAITTSTE